MLTLKQLEVMEPNTIFAKGEIVDSPDGINATNGGGQLRWVACRGGIHDWAVYCGKTNKDWKWIQYWGDKVTGEENIRKVVPCEDEAFNMYRY